MPNLTNSFNPGFFNKIMLLVFRGLLVLFLGTCRLEISAQQLAEFKQLLASDFSEEIKREKADSVLLVMEQNQYDSLPYALQRMARQFYNLDNNSKAIAYGEKAFESAKQFLPENKELHQELLNNMALYYRNNNQCYHSIQLSRKVLAIEEQNHQACWAYFGLGKSYLLLEDYYNAEIHFKNAISRLNDSLYHPDQNELLTYVYFRLLVNYLYMHTQESLRQGIVFGKTADSLANIYLPNGNRQYYIKKHLGSIYTHDEVLNINRSENYYRQALLIAQKLKNRRLEARVYYSWGGLYNESDPQLSIALANKAMLFKEYLYDNILYYIHYGYGLDYGHLGNYPKSITHKYIALDYLTGLDFRDLKDFEVDGFDDFQTGRLKVEFAELAEAYMLQYETTLESAFLDSSRYFFGLMDQVIDRLQANYRNPQSKLYWRGRTTGKYGFAIRAAYLAKDHQQAFYFMEKNKALVLSEEIAQRKFKSNRELPLDLLARDESLRLSIDAIKKQLNNPEGMSKQASDSLNQLRVDLDLELLALQDTLIEQGYAFEFIPEIVSLKQVQETLAPDQVVLECHISVDDGHGIYTNNEKAYALFITRDTSLLCELDAMCFVKEDVTRLITLQKKPFITPADKIEYTELSNLVYRTLFPSKKVQHLIRGKKLTIIPDNYLSLLPFEALSLRSDSLDYLINYTTTNYLYSYTFLHQHLNDTLKNTSYLAMAPVTFDQQQLPTLTYSKQEIESLDNYYSGMSYSEGQATKKTFLASASDYGILHLATHADANDSLAPWIAFSEDNLTVDELYQTANKASLVVLSGCNTSLGKQQVGEGMLSLTRGFFYGGSQSVISSLWNLDDKATTYLMDRFYDNLSAGQTKSEALRNAKLNYLENHHLTERSPYFWASLILSGKDDTLVTTSNKGWWIVGLVFLVLLIPSILYRKRDKQALP